MPETSLSHVLPDTGCMRLITARGLIVKGRLTTRVHTCTDTRTLRHIHDWHWKSCLHGTQAGACSTDLEGATKLDFQ